MFPRFFTNQLEKNILYDYLETQTYLDKNLPLVIKSVTSTIKGIIESHIIRLASIDRKLDYVHDLDMPESERYDIYDILLDHTLEILGSIVEATYNTDLFSDLHELICRPAIYQARSYFTECYLPDDYLLPYEFVRVPFSRFGYISKGGSDDTTKMLVAGLIIVRVLVLALLLNVNEAFKRTLDISETALVNIRLIGCILLCTFELTYSGLEDEDYVAMKERVKLGRRIYPRNDIPASCKVPIIPGCPQASGLPYLNDDFEGLEKLQEFMYRIIDNLCEPARDMRQRALNTGEMFSVSSRRDIISERSK